VHTLPYCRNAFFDGFGSSVVPVLVLVLELLVGMTSLGPLACVPCGVC
jgi:hypothetical protein